jgi:CRISPR-associated endonuclease Csn1
MKRILGLDLGTNSIGWALVERNYEDTPVDNTLGEGEILGIGSRIIPMDKGMMDAFGSGGQIETRTSERTGFRGVRRLNQRHLLRRERLHRVLNIINALPKHYAGKIDFENKKGQFIDGQEVKLNYKEIEPGKFEFLFKDSFKEMVKEFENVGQTNKIPYDWTIYYLRKKALESKIGLQELAWILLNFNQKRGYYQLRGEEEEGDKSKLVEFHALKVTNVLADEPNAKGDIWYNVHLENGWIYRRPSKNPINDWVGKTKEFIVTTTLNEDGSIKTDKEGNEKRSFKAVDSEQDWIAIKKSTEEKIENTKQFVGTYVYNTLLQNPKQKINGKLVRTIERHFYKDELTAILKKQKEFHPELNDDTLLEKCIIELYSNNYARQSILKQNDFSYLLVNDIIFYQRPLKSKKSLIDGCKYETRTFKNKDGEIETRAIRAIHKSHPLYQEFRLWQFVDNIRIYEREKIVDGKLKSDVDVTSEFIPDEESKVKLFEFFNDKAKIKQKTFLANYKDNFGKKLGEDKYRWNYVEDKEYPLNDTRAQFISRLKTIEGFASSEALNSDFETKLWHIIYSVKDKKQYEQALKTFASKNNIDTDAFFEAFKNFKPFSNDYGALSEKAIKKILPLMRMGEYWSYNAIDDNTKGRIQKIIDGEYDEKIEDRVREKAINLKTEEDFKGLPQWLASYIVYDRHSESSDNIKWETPRELDEFLKEFKQHSLRNPIVEQVITETLRVVQDIWQHYGNGEKNFFDEIHVELGRDMKNPADRRKRMTEQINKNQDTNERVRNLLREFKAENMEGVIPHSPSQQEKLKIFEEDILSQYSDKELEKEIYDGINISKVAKSSEPTAKEIQKYKLWMEQKYRSPYTGEVIPLSKLFTTDYEIEHVIPQAKYFDNSFGNKVICETEVNKTKGNQTAFEFISKNRESLINLGKGKSVKLFDLTSYQDFVSQNFKKGSKKFKLLLSEDVPEQFIARQMNDTRYISKVVKGLLSNIVRTPDEQEATSKNLVSVTGGVTTELKSDWGLNDKWNEIVQPRFERLNRLTGTNDFGYFDKNANFFRTEVPKELKKGFNKKRIDHRHHAMDALVVALATRNHVSYLGNEHAKSDNKRYDLRNKLRRVEDIQVNGKTIKISKEFYLPWRNFPVEAKNALENIVVSFKQNLRVINKASNKYQVRKNDKLEIRKQEGTNWAIRKPMHKETVYGKVQLRFKKTVTINAAIDNGFLLVDKQLNNLVKKLRRNNYDNKLLKKYFKDRNNKFNDQDISKVKVYYFDDNYSAVRKSIDESFKSEKWIKESVTDVGIQKILINHLKKYNETDEKGNTKERPDLAFSSEGLDEMNRNIVELNGGKLHQPIYKARVYETLGNKFVVGTTGNKKAKYVEAAKGTNLFFAIYEGKNKKGEIVRQYETVPLNIVIERQKQGLSSVSEKYYDKDNLEYQLLFSLSPNDLVYVPADEELENINAVDYDNLDGEQKSKVYKFVSCTGNEGHFVPAYYSNQIIKNEMGTNNKSQNTLDNKIQIKSRCIKLKVNRLGNIVGIEK